MARTDSLVRNCNGRLCLAASVLAGAARYSVVVMAAVALGLLSTPARGADNEFLVLCYHSFPERYNGDPMAISAGNLATQLSWLRDQGYTALRMDDVLRAKAGKHKLPRKSFLLTVDDGYEDFYTNGFPVLKLYNVPAVFAVVGKWIEAGVPLGNEADPHFKKQRFVKWAQLREMVKSGLVEVASHSYDLHHGVLANPQGNTQPAAVSLKYFESGAQYETVAQLRARVRADLEKNSALIAKHLGKRPRIMVWPYGAHDGLGVAEAKRAGMPINFTLDDGLANARDLTIVPRALAEKEMPLGDFSYLVQAAFARQAAPVIRAMKIDLDSIYHRDRVIQNENVGKLLDRVQALGLNAIFVEPFATARDGLANAAYFPTAIMPVRADLLNRVAWQLRSRLSVEVYALLRLTDIGVNDRDTKRALDLTSEADRQRLLTLYGDLASHTPVRGAIFIDVARHAELYKKVLAHVNEYRPPAQPLSVGYVQTGDIDIASTNYSLAIVSAPTGDDSADIAKFAASLPRNQVSVVSLPVDRLRQEQIAPLVERIRLLQRHGLTSFMLSGGTFLDDPVATGALRQALSLKNNPYLQVGQ